MMSEPVVNPLTRPVPLTTLMPLLVVLHVPPAVASLTVAVPPVHIESAPLMAVGVGSTSMLSTATAVAVPQVLLSEYFTVSTPVTLVVTTPPLIEAMEELLRLHAPLPPDAVSVKVTLPPVHTAVRPDIEPGLGAHVTWINTGFI